MKKSSYWLLGLPLLMLGGCNLEVADDNPLKGIAGAILAGQTFDQFVMADDRGDDAGITRAGKEFQRLAPVNGNKWLPTFFTSSLIQSGGEKATLSGLAKGDEKYDLLLESDRKYRLAQAFAPLKSPEKVLGPVSLNGLGYFLADRGNSQRDFDMAVLYTKAAYDSWPVSPGPVADLSQVDRAVGPQDSYAWALHRAGRSEEAKVQEELVLSTTVAIDSSTLTAEIPFHMAEIYRGLGEIEKSNRFYRMALGMKPDEDMKLRINFGIQSLVFREV